MDLNNFFKALTDQTRLRIIHLLLHYNALNVKDLCTILKQPQGKISRHLNILRNSHWVVFTRRDKWVYYKINPEINDTLISALKELFQNQLQYQSDLQNARNKY